MTEPACRTTNQNVRPWGWSIALGVLAFAPLLIWWSRWRTLFWFGDEWELIDHIDRFGFWPWVWRMFAENFVPLFKVLWGGAAILAGDYRIMLLIVWVTHALNTALFARLMLANGFGRLATVIAAGLFTLAYQHFETLGWTVQWSAILSVTFLLAGMLVPAIAAIPGLQHGRGESWTRRLLRAGCSLASAWSFSRGVITGGILALHVLLDPATGRPSFTRQRLVSALFAFAPALLTTGLIVTLKMRTGGAVSTGGATVDMFAYGAWYFFLNPLHRWFEIASMGWATVGVLGTAKILLLGYALLRGSGGVRSVVALFLVFDAANALLLGYGRHHTGLETVVSSRYQYASWLATMPTIGWFCERLLARIPTRFGVRLAATAAALSWLGWSVTRGWDYNSEWFCRSRGAESRAVLLAPAAPPANYEVPGIPFLPASQARDLIVKYDLK